MLLSALCEGRAECEVRVVGRRWGERGDLPRVLAGAPLPAQAMMDALLAPPDFPLAEEAAGAIKTLGMAMFWAPVLPPSLFLAAAGERTA